MRLSTERNGSVEGGKFPAAGGAFSSDFRLICDCQRHRGRGSASWRTARRGGSVAAILAASLGLGAVNLPAPIFDYDDLSRDPIVARASVSTAAPASTPVEAIEKLLFGTPGRRSPRSERMTRDFFRAAMPYGEIIYDEARRNHLPPDLVAAIVNTESDFRPWLRSGKEAMGLMQIIPSTGRLMGARNLFDPEDNVRAGTRYLRYLNRRFKGNLVMVLAAYNAGEGTIERFGGMPPFRETLNYIRRVTVTRDRLARELANHLVLAESGLRVRPPRLFRQPARVYDAPLLAATLTPAPVTPEVNEATVVGEVAETKATAEGEAGDVTPAVVPAAPAAPSSEPLQEVAPAAEPAPVEG